MSDDTNRRERLIEAVRVAVPDGTPEGVLDAVLPIVADEIERLDWVWHFRGPGDYGVQVVSRAAAADVVRSLGPVGSIEGEQNNE